MSVALSVGEITRLLLPAAQRIDARLAGGAMGAVAIRRGAGSGADLDKLNTAGSGVVDVGQDSFRFPLFEVGDRHGFEDGSLLDGLLLSWGISRGWVKGGVFIGGAYVSSNWLFWSAWKRFLLKESGGFGALVKYNDFAENPLYTYNYSGSGKIVGVSSADLIELADEIFPRRGAAWLEIFGSMEIYNVGAEGRRSIREMIATEFEDVYSKVGSEVWELYLGTLYASTDTPPYEYVSFAESVLTVAGAIGV